jgi:hypothetical protein
MPDYRRAWRQGGTYFFTVNLLERRRTLLVDHIDLLRNVIGDVRRHFPFRVLRVRSCLLPFRDQRSCSSEVGSQVNGVMHCAGVAGSWGV